MKLQFMGAAQTVTGSRYLISTDRTKGLVDCGLFQGFKFLRLKNWAPMGFAPHELKFVILTHAHIDHSGALPLLYKQGFRGPVYTTPATLDLCRIMLADSGHLQEEEARLANLKGFSKHHPAEPLYTQNEAEATLSLFRPVEWHKRIDIDDLSFELIPSGHLLGAASVGIRHPRGRLLMSGDLGRSLDPLVRAPESPPGADWLVMESTYGDRRHESSDPSVELRQIIRATTSRGGTVVIPTFAVGRAQSLLFHIQNLKAGGHIPMNLPVYLNSPMAKAVNGVFRRHLSELKLTMEQVNLISGSARAVSTVEESIALNEDPTPKVILAASGMASGGRVLHHLKRYATDARSAVVFVGFQAPGTRGEAMIHGAERVKIHGEYWPIRAAVLNISTLSAHADACELVEWVGRLAPAPRRIFLTHGEPSAAEALRVRLRDELGLTAEIPEMMSVHEF